LFVGTEYPEFMAPEMFEDNAASHLIDGKHELALEVPGIFLIFDKKEFFTTVLPLQSMVLECVCFNCIQRKNPTPSANLPRNYSTRFNRSVIATTKLIFIFIFGHGNRN
jgi:hypothetical protein